MKNLVWAVLVLLTICVAIPVMWREPHNAEVSTEEKATTEDDVADSYGGVECDYYLDTVIVVGGKAYRRPIEGFRQYDRRFEYEIQEDSTCDIAYAFRLDYPDESLAGRDEIRRWLVGLVESSHDDRENPDWSREAKYKGSPTDLDKLSEYASEVWWANMKDRFYTHCLFLIAEYRAMICNERFVTYFKYAHWYSGGAHGMFTENLVSYDLVHQRAIDNGYLFRPGTTEKVAELLFDAIAHDEKFRDWNEDKETGQAVREMIYCCGDLVDEEGMFRLPEAGLTEQGVVFSFQPYELAGFAAGCLHITVTYDKMKPYLSKRAVSMLRL